MTSYDHKKLRQRILDLDALPSDPAAYSKWIDAEAHLKFLAANARSDELVIYGSGPYSFVHTLAVPNKALSPLNQGDLLKWSSNPYTRAASYCYGVCDLRTLPHSEQLHWLAYNEPPKAAISKAAYTTDFEGNWTDTLAPRQQVFAVVQRWGQDRVVWWKLRDRELLDRANKPLTASRDEWGDAIMDLAKLVVEGFQLKAIRARLEAANIAFDDKDPSIFLLEKILALDTGASVPLKALREIQKIRSKVKGHAEGTEGKALATQAIETYGSFGDHFDAICIQIAAELAAIERAFRNTAA